MTDHVLAYAFVEGRARIESEYLSLLCRGAGIESMARRRAILLPSDKRISLKRVQCGTDGRCVVEIKGAAAAEAKNGSWFFPEETLPEWGSRGYAVPVSGSTVPAGKYRISAREIRPTGKPERDEPIIEIGRQGALIRFRAERPFPQLPGREYRLREPGGGTKGGTIFRSFRLLIPGTLDGAEESKLRSWVQARGIPDPRELPEFFLSIRGWSFLPADLVQPYRQRIETGEIDAVIVPGDEIIMRKDYLLARRKELLTAADRMGGMARDEALGLLPLPRRAARAVASGLKREGGLAERQGRVVVEHADAAGRLSPAARGLLGQAEHAGAEGVDITAESLRGLRREAKDLEVMGLLVPLEGGSLLSRSAYRLLVLSALEGLHPGERISAGVLRKERGFSRARIDALIERMELDGYIAKGDRQVIRRPEPPVRQDESSSAGPAAPAGGRKGGTPGARPGGA